MKANTDATAASTGGSKVNYNRFLLLVAGLGGLLYGVDVGIIAGALPYLEATSGLSGNQLSFIVAAVLLGSVISTLFAGMLADLMGRKKLMFLSGLLFVLSIPMIALSHGYGSLVLGRLLQGVSAGLIGVVVPLYLAECLGASNRGKGTGMFQWLLTLGIVIAAVIGYWFSLKVADIEKLNDPQKLFAFKDTAWRSIFWVSLPPGILFVIGSLMVAESPRWLFRRGRRDGARAALSRSRMPEQVEVEMKEMEETLKSDFPFGLYAGVVVILGGLCNPGLITGDPIAFIIALLSLVAAVYSYKQSRKWAFVITLAFVLITGVSSLPGFHNGFTVGLIKFAQGGGIGFLLGIGALWILKQLPEKLVAVTSDALQKATLFQRKYVIPFILACIILACNQATGVNSIIGYNTNILIQAGLSDAHAHLGYVIFTLVNFLMTMVAVALVDKKGRKFLLSVGSAGIICSLVCTGLMFRGTEAQRLDKKDMVQSMVVPSNQTVSVQFGSEDTRRLLLGDSARAYTLVVIYSYGDFTSASKVVRSDDPTATIDINRDGCLPATRVAAFFQNPFADLDKSRTAPLHIDNAIITPVPSENRGWLTSLFLFCFMAFFATGPGVCVWLALSELMPTRIRSNGMSIALLINQAVSTTIAAVFLPSVGKHGYSTMFFIFAGCTVVYFLTAAFFLPETKGKTLEEIEEHFEGKNK